MLILRLFCFCSTGIGNEPTVQEMVANTAYGVLVAEGGSRPPPLPPKSHRNNRNLEGTYVV